jgi:hypothetical protein
LGSSGVWVGGCRVRRAVGVGWPVGPMWRANASGKIGDKEQGMRSGLPFAFYCIEGVEPFSAYSVVEPFSVYYGCPRSACTSTSYEISCSEVRTDDDGNLLDLAQSELGRNVAQTLLLLHEFIYGKFDSTPNLQIPRAAKEAWRRRRNSVREQLLDAADSSRPMSKVYVLPSEFIAKHRQDRNRFAQFFYHPSRQN